MSAAKRRLALFIYNELPQLLADHGGAMQKSEARRVLEQRFKRTGGWSDELDDVDGGTRTVADNAWGWGTRWLYEAGVTERCAKRSEYALRPRPGGPNLANHKE